MRKYQQWRPKRDGELTESRSGCNGIGEGDRESGRSWERAVVGQPREAFGPTRMGGFRSGPDLNEEDGVWGNEMRSLKEEEERTAGKRKRRRDHFVFFFSFYLLRRHGMSRIEGFDLAAWAAALWAPSMCFRMKSFASLASE